ncbi:RIP metalloprotease RseP [Uliginosibacterium flavum]|uniref:Zinc metalloprotease n=1 Tax=Uliginosibacterium flavum TaxID=1396831 RepID=A0ABV2TKZ8_9RHOO
MNSAHYIFFFLLAIGILIVVHELGHYAAARLCGVKVLRFSLGFGPQILMRRVGSDQTEWSLAAVPLGGYVKMLDEREGSVNVGERHRAFNTQSLGRRSFIVAAGPLANLLLAILIYWGMACAGTRDFPAVLGPVASGSSAAQAGLVEGDRVTRFAGVEIRGWSDLKWLVVQHALDAERVKLEVQREGIGLASFDLAMQGVLIDEKAPDALKQLGVSLPAILTVPVLGRPLADSPADLAGFAEGDRVRKVDGFELGSAAEFVKIIAASPGRTLSVQVERAGKLLTLEVRPESVADKPLQGRIGIPVGMDRDAVAKSIITVRYGVLEGGVHAVSQTFSTAGFYLQAIWHIVKGNISWRNVSGPIAIADAAGQSAKAGVDAYLGLIAALSVSLGVLNLLPIPILDGGHLLYYAIERIRGRALSEGAEELSQRIGLVMLVLLMSLAFFNDFHRVFFG